MKNVIPYTKEIKFATQIAEICSISLENEINIESNEINGNFIISGEYKSHEISVNKENFEYKLPFSVDVTDKIDKESIEFEITDFTYEIINNDTLKINIEFALSYQELEEPKVDNAELEDFRNDISNMFLEEAKEEEDEILEERLDEESKNIIMSNANNIDDEFITYNIHIVKENDTIESICEKYNTDINYLKEYNNLDNINLGDKIVIPENVD